MLNDRLDPGLGQAADDDIPFTDELPHKQRRPYRNRGLLFAAPERIASLTNGRGRFPQWMGHCPCHDDETPSLSIRWGRNRNTVIKCHAGCSNQTVLAHFRELGYRLDPAPPPSAIKPEPEAMARALRRLTRVERAVREHLADLGEGPARMEDIAKAIGASPRSVKYAIPVLEWLGLTRVRRFRYDQIQNGYRPNRYEPARDGLFRDLNPDDDALKAELKTARRGEWPAGRHNFGATPPSAKNCTYSYENEVAVSNRVQSRPPFASNIDPPCAGWNPPGARQCDNQDENARPLSLRSEGVARPRERQRPRAEKFLPLQWRGAGCAVCGNWRKV